MDCDPMAANKHLEKPRKSNTICAGVTGKMPGHTEGWLRMLCLNTDRKFVRKGHHETQKWDVYLPEDSHRSGENGSIIPKRLQLSAKAAQRRAFGYNKWNDQTVIIPSRYDHRSGGGWWVDYVYATLSHRQKQHMKIWTAVTARLGISPLSVCGSSTADAAL